MQKVLAYINFVFFSLEKKAQLGHFFNDAFSPEITYAVWACEQNENTYMINFNYFKHEGVAVFYV